MKVYSIQIPFSKDEEGHDDWIYVTTEHPNGIVGDRIVVTYNSEQEAKEAGAIWKRFRVIEFNTVAPEEKAWAEQQVKDSRFDG